MSDEHKEALAEGRNQGRVVRAYLEALEQNKPKRGRKRTTDSIDKRLAAIETEIGEVDPLKRLRLTQERLDLTAERAVLATNIDMSALEDDFIVVAKAYAERKGISYAAFRDIGVSAAVLSRAGITRGS